jgi:hypothetical protein
VGNEQRQTSIQTSFARAGASGFVTGVCNAIITQPIDTIKTRQQIAKLNPTAPRYLNVFQGISMVYKQEGLGALYRGLPPSLLTICTSMTLFFPTYERFKHSLAKEFGLTQENTFVVLPSVVAAWSLSSTFTSPISLCKVRLQTRDPSLPKIGLFQLGSQLLKEEGIRGLYRGYKGTWMFCVLFGTHFSLYEPLKKRINDRRAVPLLSAATSSFAMVITYPNDVILTRLLYQCKTKKYDGYLDCFKQTVKQDGIRSLYVGMTTQAVKYMIGSMVTFSVYEAVRNWNTTQYMSADSK